MTVTSSTRNVVYTGNGATLDFDFTFYVPSQDELEVFLYTIATEVETELTPSQYDLQFNVGNVGGTVTYPNTDPPTAISSTHKLIIQRTIPVVQALDISTQVGFNPTTFENQLDLIVMMIQQVAEELSRTFVISAGSSIADLADLYVALLAAKAAAETAEANSELAETNAETAETNAELAETNAETAATAAAASAALAALDQLGLAISDEVSVLTAGTAKLTFRMPYAMTLSEVRANVNTAPTGSTLVVDINKNGTTMLSIKLSIDAGEKTSVTATTPAVISVTALASDDELTVDIDQVGSTVAGKGLKIWLKGTRS